MIFVRHPTFTCAGTLWLIPNNIPFTCFLVLLIVLLHPTFIFSLLIVGEELPQSFYFAKISENFPDTSQRPSNSKYFRKIQPSHFYKREINRLQTVLLLFIEICVQKKHFSLIEMFADLLSVPTPTVIKHPPKT